MSGHFIGGKAVGDQQYRRNVLANGAALRATIQDAGVWNSGGGNRQKIVVMRQQHAPLAQGEIQMFLIGRSYEMHIDRHRHIDTSATKSVGNCGIDVFVEMELEGHILSGMLQLGTQLGRILFPQRLRKVLGLLHLLIDLLAMSMIVAEGSVDSGQRQLWMRRDNFIGRAPQPLMPNGNILHAHPRTRDTWLATAHSRS